MTYGYLTMQTGPYICTVYGYLSVLIGGGGGGGGGVNDVNKR